MRDRVHPEVAEEIRALDDERLHSAVVELEAWARRAEFSGGRHHDASGQVLITCVVEQSGR